MNRWGHVGARVAGVFGTLIALTLAAQAQNAKEITLYVGSGAGGPYDAYARLIGRHLGQHLPGHPSIVVQNMPGAAGRRLMGYMYNVAPKDGSAIATIQRGVPFDALIGVNKKFDPAKIAWLGSANSETNVCMAWHTSQIKTIEDVKTKQMVVGTSGPSSTDAIYPNMLSYLFGMKFKVIGGYKSATTVHVAMERGEVDDAAASVGTRCRRSIRPGSKKRRSGCCCRSGSIECRNSARFRSCWTWRSQRSSARSSACGPHR